ncbi:MAG: hypothetical protein HY898_28010 [Deltaproteobacteria bacterium]|nr:hypothetical protein [Deltaproteobacteria bacterium]
MLSRSILTFAAASLMAMFACEKTAGAQGYPPQPYPPQPYPPQTYPPQTYPPQTYPPQQYPPQQYPPGGNVPWTTPASPYPPAGGYGYTPVQPAANSKYRTDIEMGVLYGTAATYGVGVGIWLDVEAGIDDPGLKFIAPVVLGVGAPVGAYFLDQPKMPKGMPAAISAGLFLGAGEGLGIWAYQFTTTNEADAWGFKGLSRAMTLGSTIGGVGGFAAGYYLEPSPKASAFASSGAMWGAVVGSMVGYGSTSADNKDGWKDNNDGASLGGLIGYNVGLGATAAMSTIYTPSWMNLAWMWIGGGIGAAAGLPVYLAYAGSDKPAKRGLMVQGLFTGIGIVAGGIFSAGLKDDDYITVGKNPLQNKVAQVTGFGLMPVPGGAGVQIGGLLF